MKTKKMFTGAIIALMALLFISGCYSGSLTGTWPRYDTVAMMSYNNNYQPFDKYKLIEKFPALEGVVLTAHEYMEEVEKMEKEAREIGQEGPEEYRLSIGLTLQITVWQEPSLSMTIQIRPDGKIDYPLIGEIIAAGKTIKEFKNELITRLKEFVVDPKISLQMPYTAGIIANVSTPTVSMQGFGCVTFFGSINTAGYGLVNIPGPQKFSKVLALGGGIAPDAEIRQIRVIKPNLKKIVIVDWLSYIRDMDWRQDITVNPDDIIFIPRKWTIGDEFESDWDIILRYLNGVLNFNGFYNTMIKK